jgi:hypothetical protein
VASDETLQHRTLAGGRAQRKVSARRGHLINCQVLSPSKKARRGALPDINISDSVAH